MDIRSGKGVAVGITQRGPEDENRCRKGDLQPFLRVIGSPCPLGFPCPQLHQGAKASAVNSSRTLAGEGPQFAEGPLAGFDTLLLPDFEKTRPAPRGVPWAQKNLFSSSWLTWTP